MLEVHRKLIDLLDRREKYIAGLVFGLMVIVAFAEAIGVASILPFIAVLANPQVVVENRFLSKIYAILGFDTVDGFMLFLGGIVFVLLVGSLAMKAVSFWAQQHFAHMRNHSIGHRLVASYLAQPYEWCLDRHTADMAKSVLSEVGQVVHHAMFPAMQIVAHGLVALSILALLIAVDPVLAVTCAVVLGGVYSLIFATIFFRLRELGLERRNAQRTRFRIANAAFSGFKDIKIAGLEPVFLERFREASNRFAQKNIASKMLSELPSFAVQALLFGGMLLILMYLMVRSGGLEQALPTLGLYAVAGYRLMPALQATYMNLSQLRYSLPMLDALHSEVKGLEASKDDMSFEPLGEMMPLRRVLALEGVYYSYPKASHPTLNGIDLTIRAQTTVGFVGSTGSGKTTTVDILLGMLRPQQGKVKVDNEEIDQTNVRRWRRNVGYVPQQIFLLDDSVAANIAFGIPKRAVDMAAVERAARIANIHDFVVRELAEGYDTRIGERGIRLSGGQRQRIGIARALYHDPGVLIFDEATSALDNITEEAVMEAIRKLGSEKTIILIAHRLSTVKECDEIFLFAEGKVVERGTYSELVASNAMFRRMAEAT